MKKTAKMLAVLALCFIVLAAAGCQAPQNDTLEINTAALQYGTYTYKTTVASKDAVSEYDTVYDISYQKYQDTDAVYIHAVSQKGTAKNETTTVITAAADDKYTALTPLWYKLDYSDSDNMADNTVAEALYNHKDALVNISVFKYPEGSAEMAESKYSVQAGGQYYDAASLQFVLSCLPLSVGYKRNFTLSSANRESLQSMYMEVIDEMSVTAAGSDYDCFVVAVRPNSVFTSYATYMYFEKNTGRLILMKDSSYNVEFKSFTPAE